MKLNLIHFSIEKKMSISVKYHYQYQYQQNLTAYTFAAVKVIMILNLKWYILLKGIFVTVQKIWFTYPEFKDKSFGTHFEIFFVFF